jgi:predicted ester cyclase
MLRKVSRLYLYGLLLILLLATAACQPVQALSATQTTATASAEAKVEQANKAVIERFYEEALNQKQMNVMDELNDPQIVVHDLGATPDVGMLFTGLPDLHVTVDLWILKGDLVTTIVSFTGTHQGEMMGIAPTNKVVTWSHIDIHRVTNGKIVEVWHNVPMSDILAQIGYTSVPPAQ